MTERLSPNQFVALCRLIWSGNESGWQKRAAEFLGVSLRNVQFFAAEPPSASKPVPYGVRDELLGEVRRLSQDPAEEARMRAWVARCEAEVETMREALG